MKLPSSLIAAAAAIALAIPIGIATADSTHTTATPASIASAEPSDAAVWKPGEPVHRERGSKRDRGCGSRVITYSHGTFTGFTSAFSMLESKNFNAFDRGTFRGFGRAFAHRLPERKLSEQLAIYGYDYLGAYRGYLLFYRRPVGWLQVTSLPPVIAPNGQAIPQVPLPSDLNPEWPSPGMLVARSPFLGAVALPQQIIAFPCED